MKRSYNFSAGPAALPLEVLKEVQEEFLDWQGHGFSIVESSHRNPSFVAMAEEAEQDLRELMRIPKNYKVLFISGGASFQFSAIPLNLAGKNRCADYFHTGLWSYKSIVEAKRYCNVNIVTSNQDSNFIDIPDPTTWKWSDNAAYITYTPNETVHGVSFPTIPQHNNVPVIADMTSNMLQEEVDVSEFGAIYAGVQKNIAPAGLTIVIIRDDLLDQAMDICPSLLNYRLIDERHSIPNTPPTFSWYIAGKTFKWVKANGGIREMVRRSKVKSTKLYNTIDESAFYINDVKTPYRSTINVPFRISDAQLNTKFIEEAEKENIQQIKGHASMGGMRASLYNGVNENAVDALTDFMKSFEKKFG